MILVGTLRRQRIGYAGKYAKDLPAGTLVEFDDEREVVGWHVGRVVGRRRITLHVRAGEVEPA